MKLNRKWILVIALVMSLAMATGGTLAYLQSSDTETNTFTVGSVKIELTEPSYPGNDKVPTLLPGVEIEKDPQITNTSTTTPAWVWMEITMPTELYKTLDIEWDNTGYWAAPDINSGASETVITMKLADSEATLAPLDTTDPAFTKISLDKDITDLSNLGNGTVDIVVNAYAIQNYGFADITEAMAAYNKEVGGDEGGEGDNDSIEVPADAVEVSNAEELTNALTAGGTYKITAPITVNGVQTVAADTALYNEDSANVLTFAQNARLTIAENANLALYGVKIDGGESFRMENDGTLSFDADTQYNNDAILKANAGSTLTLGKGTVIENVVSTGSASAVASAKGTEDNRATIILEGATIKNCVGGSGTAINVDNYGDVYIEEGTVISDNVSYDNQNHGIVRIYNPWDATNPSTLTMNGGEIRDNYFSGNGAIGLYYGKMTMNGGKISGNSWYLNNEKNNGFYCVVYVHSNAQFTMHGGEISGNTITDGAINAINSEVAGAITFNGGTVTNNSNTRNDNKDALAAVCYPGAVATTDGTEKVLVISNNANVTGTIYNHADLTDTVVRNYSEISEFFSGN